MISDLRRHRPVTQFHQHVAGVSDGELVWFGERVLKIFVAEMKIASQAEAGRFNSPGEFGNQLTQGGAVVCVPLVRVRCGDDVVNAVRRSHPAHFDADLPRFRAVVHLRQDVTVNINHAFATESCSDLNISSVETPTTAGMKFEIFPAPLRMIMRGKK